eukprot:TRINITY_DN1374_c0_g2_i6.p1 TRINITY_DN1374_c0_g2~~TRINITY_DN1374_c0_g2_i6.p1  ORF type:complete len:141 (+),score=25.67 TRINITY_DN1374_c0_g2_i6:260-682(+)
MKHMASYIKGLLISPRLLDDNDIYYTGRVFRRSKLSSAQAQFYEKGKLFLWSSFSSTTVQYKKDLEANNTFGDTLFVIDIPESLKSHAVLLEKVSTYPEEREVLILPNVSFQVLEVKKGEFEEMSNVIFLKAVYVITIAL